MFVTIKKHYKLHSAVLVKITAKSLFCFFVIVILNTPNLISQNLATKIVIEPLNRAVVYFDTFPIIYSTELSADKKRITISIINSSIVDSARRISGTGIISDVYSKTTNNNLTLEILLKENRGYTAVALPFTKSLIIEVFDWKKLNPNEDLLRTGLLSYEDKIIVPAKNDLTNSVIQGNLEAPAYLGILLLKMGKINSARENLLFAEKAKSNLPDIYAALSQIYTIKNDKVWTDHYNEKFAQLTGLFRFSPMEIAEIIEKDSSFSEPIEHLKELSSKLVEPIKIDSTEKSGLNSKFKNIIGDSTKANSQTTNTKIFPWWFNYVIGFIVTIFILLLYFYLKWRNQRIAMINTIKQENIKANNIASNPETAKPQANRFAEAYKKQELFANKNKAKPVPAPKKIQSKIEDPEFERDVKTKPLIDNRTRKDVEKFLSTVKEKFPTKPLADKIKQDLEKKTVPVTARVELATHLAEEQQKIRSKSLAFLDDKDIPKDDSNLTKIAKQLGVEKGSLETRKNLEKIKSDSSSIRKLAEKFSLNKKDES